MFFCVITSSAQDKDIKRPDTYNYTRGVEAIQQENYKEALEYLNKEIEENPKNGYAYAWIAAIRENYQEYGRAITALDLALKYLPKKTKHIELGYILAKQMCIKNWTSMIKLADIFKQN